MRRNKVIRNRIKQLKAKGYTNKEVAQKLNEEGFTSSNGTSINHHNVAYFVSGYKAQKRRKRKVTKTTTTTTNYETRQTEMKMHPQYKALLAILNSNLAADDKAEVLKGFLS